MKTTFKRKAFTLIELLIVIAIIGVLFIVLVSKVDFATDKAKATGVQTDFRSFQVAFEQVARENSGFNTFGWDEGDIGGLTSKTGANEGIVINGTTYTYNNAAKDRGDRVRNSYDVGDMNLNGELDSDETWIGRKIYTETWTGIYTLENPCIAGDNHANDNAVIDLENAINKNLDPKLHITISDPVDGTTLGAQANSGQDQGKVYYITMKNQAVDPWKTEYVGKYLTNASANSTTNSIDANKAPTAPKPMVTSLDRGAIIIYSKGANLELGSHEEIINGSVVVYVSLKDDEKVDHNTAGQDDYSISTIYTFKNGYGEVISTTTGFSNNQTTNAPSNVTLENVSGESFEMLHKPSGEITTVENGFFVTGREIMTASESDYSQQPIDYGNAVLYVKKNNQYYADATSLSSLYYNVVPIYFGEIDYLQTAKAKLDNSLLNQKAGVLMDYTFIADWGDGRKTYCDFGWEYIGSVKVPTITYSYYYNGVLQAYGSGPHTVWVYDSATQTYILGTEDTIITNNLVFYVDPLDILMDSAMGTLD